MFLKHAPYYSLQFPRRNTTIIPHNDEEMRNLIEILSVANIAYDSQIENRLIVKLKPKETLIKINQCLKENEASTTFNRKLATIIKKDFKTISLLKAI